MVSKTKGRRLSVPSALLIEETTNQTKSSQVKLIIFVGLLVKGAKRSTPEKISRRIGVNQSSKGVESGIEPRPHISSCYWAKLVRHLFCRKWKLFLAEMAQLWKDDQFWHKQPSKFGRNDVWQLPIGRSGHPVLTNDSYHITYRVTWLWFQATWLRATWPGTVRCSWGVYWRPFLIR